MKGKNCRSGYDLRYLRLWNQLRNTWALRSSSPIRVCLKPALHFCAQNLIDNLIYLWIRFMYHECNLIQLSPETYRLFKKISVNITNHEVRVSHGDDTHSPFGLSYIFTFVGIMKCTLLLLSLQTGRLSQYFCWHQKFLSYISTNLFHYERTLLQLPFETVRLYPKKIADTEFVCPSFLPPYHIITLPVPYSNCLSKLVYLNYRHHELNCST